MPRLGRHRRHGNLRAQDKAARARGLDAQCPAERGDALAHAKQPHAGFDRDVGPGLAVVNDGEHDVRMLITTGGILHVKP